VQTSPETVKPVKQTEDQPKNVNVSLDTTKTPEYVNYVTRDVKNVSLKPTTVNNVKTTEYQNLNQIVHVLLDTSISYKFVKHVTCTV